MRNSKFAILACGIAVGFILMVAFHSPTKMLIAGDAQISPPVAATK